MQADRSGQEAMTKLVRVTGHNREDKGHFKARGKSLGILPQESGVYKESPPGNGVKCLLDLTTSVVVMGGKA